MADFAGGNSQLRFAWEDRYGQPPTSNSLWFDTAFESSDLGAELPTVPDTNLSPGAQEPEGQPGKIDVAGSLTMTAFPGKPLALLLGESLRRVTTTNPDTGVYLHRIGVSEATALKSIAARLSRDDGAPETLSGLAVSGWELDIAPGKLPTVKVDLVGQAVYRWDGGSASPGSITTTKFMTLRGLPSAALLALDDGDVYFKVTDVTGAPSSIKGKVKIGAAATYDGAELTIPCGASATGKPRWTELTDENDARIGTRDMPIEIAITTGTGWAVDDVVRFRRESQAWSSSLPAMAPLNEIYAAVTIDGDTYCLSAVKVTAKLPVAPDVCIGGRFAQGLKRDGRQEIRFEVQRSLTDLSIYNRLLTAQRVALVVRMGNGEEIATGYDYLLTMTAPRCRASGRGPEAKETLEESVTFTCHPAPGDASGYVDSITVEVQSDFPALA